LKHKVVTVISVSVRRAGQFLARMLSHARPIAYSASVRLSVMCPSRSDTRVDQSKTVEVRIMQLSPRSSPTTPVS